MRKSTAIMYDPTTQKIKDVCKLNFVGLLSPLVKKVYKKDLNYQECVQLTRLSYKEILQEFRELFVTNSKGIYECPLGPRDVLVCLIDGATSKDFLVSIGRK